MSILTYESNMEEEGVKLDSSNFVFQSILIDNINTCMNSFQQIETTQISEEFSFLSGIDSISGEDKFSFIQGETGCPPIIRRHVDPNTLPLFNNPLFMARESCKYYGVQISLESGSFFTCAKDVCLVSFLSPGLLCQPSNIIKQCLQYEIVPILQYMQSNGELGDGALVAMPAHGMPQFKEIFYLKSTQKRHLNKYSCDLLEQCLGRSLNKAVVSGHTSIVFPQLNWEGLKTSEIASILFEAIFKFCRQNSLFGLRDIMVKVDEKAAYFEYSSVMRSYCDQYVRVI